MNTTQRIAAAHAAAVEGLWLDPEQVAATPRKITRDAYTYVPFAERWTCSCGEEKATATATFPTDDAFYTDAVVPVGPECVQALARAMGALAAGV